MCSDLGFRPQLTAVPSFPRGQGARLATGAAGGADRAHDCPLHRGTL